MGYHQNLASISNSSQRSVSYLTFSWIDYTLFSIILTISASIGIYFGCFGSKQLTKSEYLHGAKKMKILPIAMSLVAGHMTSITWLGIPTEVYFYGGQVCVCVVALLLITPLTIYVFLPVFYKLQCTSSYEYFKLRFGLNVRTLASLLYFVTSLILLPVVIYLPALTFSQVTGLSIFAVIPVIGVVCTFYTALGGFKAVVWTDALQLTITITSMVLILIIGYFSSEGFDTIWKRAEEGERLEFFNMNLDPTVRNTFWTVSLGLTATWLPVMGCGPCAVQRFISLPTLRDAKMSVLYFCVGIILSKTLNFLFGFLIYARYYNCDPLTSGAIKRADQLLPFYALDVTGKVQGLPGLFVAGIFCAALSSTSALLNALSGTVYEDLITQYLPTRIIDENASSIIKVITLILGMLCIAVAFFIERLGTIYQVTFSVASITIAPLLGLYILGMLFPSANKKGALWGSIGGLLVVCYISLGAQYYQIKGTLKFQPKPLSIDGCDEFHFPSNLTITSSSTTNTDVPFWLYRISFYYYTLIGTVLVVTLGLFISWLTKDKKENPVNPDLISPIVWWMSTAKPITIYASVEEALRITKSSGEKNVAKTSPL